MKERNKPLTARILAASLLSINPTLAIIVDGDNGAGNNNKSEASLLGEHSDFNFWDNMVRVGNASGVYLGQGAGGDTGYVLTAAHVTQMIPGSDSISVAGSNFSVLGSETIGGADLRLYSIGGGVLPSLPSVKIATVDPIYNEGMIMLGWGSRAGDLTNVSGYDVYNWGSSSAGLSWGGNQAESVFGGTGSPVLSFTSGGAQQENFYTKFDAPTAGDLSNWEGMASGGDSGGAVFAYRDGEYELAGIISAVLKNRGQPDRTAAYGNRTAIVNIEHYAEKLPELEEILAVPEPSGFLLLGFGFFQCLIFRRRRTS